MLLAAQGRPFLQRRAMHKQLYPGDYIVSACGHVGFAESGLAAARREGREELGPDVKIRNLRMLFPPSHLDSRAPHRLYYTYVGDYDGVARPNPDDAIVEDSRPYEWSEVKRLMRQRKLLECSHKVLQYVADQHAKR